MGIPPLRPLHRDESLNRVKIAQFERLENEELLSSLEPGRTNCLRARPDGTMLEGHHRIYVLRLRGVDVDALPRQIEEKSGEDRDWEIRNVYRTALGRGTMAREIGGFRASSRRGLARGRTSQLA